MSSGADRFNVLRFDEARAVEERVERVDLLEPAAIGGSPEDSGTALDDRDELAGLLPRPLAPAIVQRKVDGGRTLDCREVYKYILPK